MQWQTIPHVQLLFSCYHLTKIFLENNLEKKNLAGNAYKEMKLKSQVLPKRSCKEHHFLSEQKRCYNKCSIILFAILESVYEAAQYIVKL